MTDRLGFGAAEDRTMPTVVYVLYLLALATGFTALIGVVIAYAQQGSAGARSRTHYSFLIRTFWLGLVWMIACGLLLGVAIPLSFILIGIPLLILAKFMFGLGVVWYALRCIVGVIYLARDEPYPRPEALLL